METFATFLPCFPGFYNSILHYSDMDNEAMEFCLEELYDVFPKELLNFFYKHHRLGSKYEPQVDFKSYEKDVSIEFCKVVQEKLSEILNTQVSIEFQEIHSPKEYNFTTDSVNCLITVDPELILTYCKEHLTKFKKYLRDHYKSCDGFISFYSYDSEDWMDKEEWGHHKCGSILQFILMNEIKDVEFELSVEVVEAVYYGMYWSIPETVRDFFHSPEAQKIADEYYRLMKQGDDYLKLMGTAYNDEVHKGKQQVLYKLTEELENAMEILC